MKKLLLVVSGLVLLGLPVSVMAAEPSLGMPKKAEKVEKKGKKRGSGRWSRAMHKVGHPLGAGEEGCPQPHVKKVKAARKSKASAVVKKAERAPVRVKQEERKQVFPAANKKKKCSMRNKKCSVERKAKDCKKKEGKACRPKKARCKKVSGDAPAAPKKEKKDKPARKGKSRRKGKAQPITRSEIEAAVAEAAVS
jgi:hypothetical protein